MKLFNRQTTGFSLRCIFSAALFSIALTASAADVYWDVAMGDWSSASNWNTGTQPSSGDTVYVNNGGTVQLTQNGEIANYLWVGHAAGSTGTVHQTGGDLTLLGSQFRLGYFPGSYGTYVLDNGRITTVGSLLTGVQGSGSFVQSGGTNTLGEQLYLGYESGSVGAYTISRGRLNVGSKLYMGRSGSSSTFTVDGSGCAIKLDDAYYTYPGTDTELISKIDAGGVGTISVSSGTSRLDGRWTVIDQGARPGTYHVLISADGISGSFDTVSLPTGWTWGIEDTATNDTLWVTVPPSGFLFSLSSRSIPPVPITGMETLAEKEAVVEQLLDQEWMSPDGLIYCNVFYRNNQRITQYDVYKVAPDPDDLSAEDLQYVQETLVPVTVNGMPQYQLQGSPLEDVESYEDSLQSTSTYLSGLYFKYRVTGDTNVLQRAGEVFSTLYAVYELGLQEQSGWIPKPYGFRCTQQSSMDNQCPYYMSLIRYHQIAPAADQALVEQVLTDQMDYWMRNAYHMHVPYFGIDIDYATDNVYPGHWPLMFLPLAYAAWEMTGDGAYLTEYNRLVDLLNIPAGADPDYLNTYIRAYHRWYLQYDWLLEMGASNADLWREGLGYQEAVMAPLSMYHSLACAIRIDDPETAAWKIAWLEGYLLNDVKLSLFLWPSSATYTQPESFLPQTVKTFSVAIWYERYWQGRDLGKW